MLLNRAFVGPRDRQRGDQDRREKARYIEVLIAHQQSPNSSALAHFRRGPESDCCG